MVFETEHSYNVNFNGPFDEDVKVHQKEFQKIINGIRSFGSVVINLCRNGHSGIHVYCLLYSYYVSLVQACSDLYMLYRAFSNSLLDTTPDFYRAKLKEIEGFVKDVTKELDDYFEDNFDDIDQWYDFNDGSVVTFGHKEYNRIVFFDSLHHGNVDDEDAIEETWANIHKQQHVSLKDAPFILKEIKRIVPLLKKSISNFVYVNENRKDADYIEIVNGMYETFKSLNCDKVEEVYNSDLRDKELEGLSVAEAKKKRMIERLNILKEYEPYGKD